jgi:hypothetical protein
MTLTLDQAVAELVHSPKFLAWNRSTILLEDLGAAAVMGDKQYSPDELAGLWGVSVGSIRRIFRSEPGVLKMLIRSHLTLRIPENVAERVYARLCK